MSVETDFRALLVARTQLTALVPAASVALNAVTEGRSPPLIVFAVQHDRQISLNNELLADRCSIGVQCWAETAAAADAIADQVVLAVADATAARGACVVDRASTFDADLGLDGTLLTVEWWA